MRLDGGPIFGNEFQASSPTFPNGILIPLFVDVGVFSYDDLESRLYIRYGLKHHFEHSAKVLPVVILKVFN